MLPRIGHRGQTAGGLVDLCALLGQGKEKAREILEELHTESEIVEGMIQDEMRKRFGQGVEWEVMKGFHAIPSMQ